MTNADGRIGRRLVVLGAALSLGGCGFRPVYGSGGAGQGPRQELAAIDVELIPDRAGQLLRQALQERFDRSGGVPKRYTLNVSFGVAGDAIGVQRDSTTTRIREVATATWTLKSLDPTRTVVTSGTARALDGLNVIDQQYFAVDLEGETVTSRLATTVADQITLQIAAYFARHSAPA